MTTGKAVPIPRITTPAELRSLLLECAVRVMEGRTNVSQANAVASLSAEVHKSVRQEWEMRCYAAENLSLEDGRIVRGLLGPTGEEEPTHGD